MFANLAYIPHIRQNHATSLHSSTRISLIKVISTEGPGLRLSPKYFYHIIKVKNEEIFFGAVIFEVLKEADGSKIVNLSLIFFYIELSLLLQ